MNDLIAQIGTEFRNVLSQENDIIHQFELSTIEAVDFYPNFKLDENQWFKIEHFSSTEYFIDVCHSDFSTASLIQIENKDFSKINNICILFNSERHFQRITPSLFVRKRTVLDFAGTPKIEKHRKQIEIRLEPDAVYKNDTDTLYFKSISKIKYIFPGMDNLHREATQPEVNNFLGNSFIKLSDFEFITVGVYNRKRIADIGLKFEKLNEIKKKKLINYAKKKSGIKMENGSFIIDSDTTLKNLLYAIDQRYYYADIYEEDRIANSIRVLDRKFLSKSKRKAHGKRTSSTLRAVIAYFIPWLHQSLMSKADSISDCFSESTCGLTLIVLLSYL